METILKHSKEIKENSIDVKNESILPGSQITLPDLPLLPPTYPAFLPKEYAQASVSTASIPQFHCIIVAAEHRAASHLYSLHLSTLEEGLIFY